MSSMARGSRRVRPLSRPVHHVLSEGEVSEILVRIQDRFGWPETSERFEIAGRWGSRTASLYRCRGASTGRPDVMLKVGRDWTPEIASAVHKEMDELARTIRVAGRPMVGVPDALGWDGDPPLVCSAYVEGTDLYFLLADLEHRGWSASERSPLEVLEACGRALGTYHARSVPGPSDIEARTQALHDLERAARAMAVPRDRSNASRTCWWSLAASVTSGRISSAWAGRTGCTCSTRRSPRRSSRSIGTSRGSCSGSPGPWGATPETGGGSAEPNPICGRRSSAAIATTGPTDPSDPLGRWLVRLYEGAAAAGMAHKRLHNRELVSAARYAWAWMGSLIAIRTTARPG